MTRVASCGNFCALVLSIKTCYACRLFKNSYLGVIHYSLLLMLFGAAAFKAVHTPLLTAMLVSELASVLCLAGKMQASILPSARCLCASMPRQSVFLLPHECLCRSSADVNNMRNRESLGLCIQCVSYLNVVLLLQRIAGWAPGSGLVKALRRAEIGTLLLFQLVPHFLIAVSVLVHPEAFTAKASLAPLLHTYALSSPLRLLCSLWTSNDRCSSCPECMLPTHTMLACTVIVHTRRELAVHLPAF